MKVLEQSAFAVQCDIYGFLKGIHRCFTQYIFCDHIKQQRTQKEEKKNSTYSFLRVDKNLGEKQLITVTVVSRPLSNHFFDVWKVANKA